jgi:hypothetical protein
VYVVVEELLGSHGMWSPGSFAGGIISHLGTKVK